MGILVLLANWGLRGKLFSGKILLPTWGYRIYQVLLVFLMMAAPSYSYWRQRQLTQKLVQKLGVNVKLVRQQVTLIDGLMDMGEPRGIYSEYQILEPREVARAKMIQRIIQEEGKSEQVKIEHTLVVLGWQVHENKDSADCLSLDLMGEIAQSGFGIGNDGILRIYLKYPSFLRCRLH